MRAQVLRAFGGPENFELTDVPKPAIRPGMVLIRVAAAFRGRADEVIDLARTNSPCSII
jgi:NADPH:quinone reductase-like Zn-dependent oxidoreductase